MKKIYLSFIILSIGVFVRLENKQYDEETKGYWGL
tara:strand:- start:161 stop:265 length:105 start_codon:yes stop_codon:yes gene_type:complete